MRVSVLLECSAGVLASPGTPGVSQTVVCVLLCWDIVPAAPGSPAGILGGSSPPEPWFTAQKPVNNSV